ncbi:MAG TPA: hypothetical protein VGM67_11910 [Gemmatimonadaceae bacterium]|jgi:hypothetical protein
MSSAKRTFGALVSHDGVCLVEYAVERTGIRVVGEWSESGHSASIGDALERLRGLLSANDVRGGSIALAIDQFGVFHHVMMLPGANDDVLRPVVRREVQRVFGVTDPAFVFTRGGMQERRAPGRADARTAPRQLFVAGASRETVDALASAFPEKRVYVDIATVVPKAIHSLYQASGGGVEPTAVLVCLDGGPHLSFFLDGRLELAIDPPIALEGDRPSPSVIVDQVERGAVYFRQQFRGAEATRLLLATRENEYAELAAAIEQRIGVRVSPLFEGTSSPEAVVAMGAVLEARNEDADALDLYPHPPTIADRAAVLMRGPNLAVSAAVAAAVIAGFWAFSQFTALSTVRRETTALRAAARSSAQAVEPMRQIAERRADFTRQAAFVEQSDAERATLTAALEAIAEEAPVGVHFDSLRVSRSAAGWSGAIDGQTSGATTAQSVRSLETFFNAVRAKPGVSSASLDQFNYPSSGPDTTHAGNQSVGLVFRITFEIARTAAPAAAGTP